MVKEVSAMKKEELYAYVDFLVWGDLHQKVRQEKYMTIGRDATV